MSLSLTEILDLVGKLDDTPGEDTPRGRFRSKLPIYAKDIGQVRDYVEECLRNKGDQYNRALQDLVNHLGTFLGFKVTFGRYQGAPGEIGFDGHWESETTGFHVVVEVKTTDAYAIKTSTLLHYINELVSMKRIPDRDRALGLYVVGRPDPQIRQLEHAIIAEKLTQQLRVVSVESLLALAEMRAQYGLGHEEVLSLMRPSEPSIDPLVRIMQQLVSGRTPAPPEPDEEEASPEPSGVAYWLTPVRSYEGQSAKECVQSLVGEAHVYAFGEHTPGRVKIKPGDWICFYACGEGVVAHAKVASAPEKGSHPKLRFPDKHPWVFKLEQPRLYLDTPVVLDAKMRAKLDAFNGRDPEKGWAWFVQFTKTISQHDFKLLTRSASAD